MLYSEKIINGSLLHGAKLIRLIEEGDEKALLELEALYGSRSANSFIIALTGPPGVGKSSLINKLISELYKKNLKIGVLLIDPSSPFSKGSILGDRIRIDKNIAGDIFIHSIAGKASKEELCKIICGALLVLEAMNFDIILLETIGAGQDQVDIARIAHLVGVVNAPGMGDGIQTIKAGILEIGDIFIVNKSDTSEAEELAENLKSMIIMRRESEKGMLPEVIKTSALKNFGIETLAELLIERRESFFKNGNIESKNIERDAFYFENIAKDLAIKQILKSDIYEKLSKNIKEKKISPLSCAIRFYDDQNKNS